MVRGRAPAEPERCDAREAQQNKGFAQTVALGKSIDRISLSSILCQTAAWLSPLSAWLSAPAISIAIVTSTLAFIFILVHVGISIFIFVFVLSSSLSLSSSL